MQFYGLLDLSWSSYIITTLVLTHITIVSVTVFLHRCQAHRALTMNPVLAHFFRFWLWLTTGMSTRAWASIHRKHHARCETSDDPHSPQILGLPMVLWKGAELYRKEATNEETLKRYSHGTPNDWLENNLYIKHSSLGFRILLVVELLLLGIPGAMVWAAQMFWIPFFAAGVINGIGHYWGYRNFECPDASTNISPWGILIGGEELHNNHHTYPTSAKLSVKWWEFDIGWCYIKLFSWLGLVNIKRTYPQPKYLPNKSEIDGDTLTAIIANRFHVMTDYSKKVLLPNFWQEKAKLRHTSHEWDTLAPVLVKETTLVTPGIQARLERFLEKHETLQRLYGLRENLQAIWNKTTASQKELLEALQDWCRQAESMGIPALNAFVRQLKGYSLIQSQ